VLSPGARLGPYEVVSPLGAGGMGEVYRARDTKLGRDVALKVLPEAFTADADRLARFEREAKVLASLNHPNIGHIYGLEEADGQKALVLELVEGPTLADRIAKGPLPPDEAVPIAKQIAEALEAAHEQGVIHRDLKPANVKVRPDLTVKVLDFGLARAYDGELEGSSSDLSQSPTLAHSGTEAGVILGTAAYMAPEQATGKRVDKRADIWAFGAVLFEVLTGQRPFTGDSVSEVLASVIKDEPSWAQLPPAVSPTMVRLLRRCLAKNPRRRLHDIADARVEIEELPLEPPAEAAPPSVGGMSPLMKWAPWALAFGLALLAAALWQRDATRAPREAPVQRFEMELPRSSSGAGSQALSPDGRLFAYTGVGQDGEWSLYIRPLGELEARKVEGTAGGEYPFFSPDSRWLGFHAYGELRKVPVEGGTPTVVCRTPEALGSTWGPHGDIVFGMPNSGLHRVDAEGGEPVRITDPAEVGGAAHTWPRFLPDGDSILFTVWQGSEPAQVALHSLASRMSTILVEGAAPCYAATGHILFWRDGALRAAAFDVGSGSITSDSTEVLTGLAPGFHGGGWFHVADTGHLVYSENQPSRGRSSELVIVDLDGRERPLGSGLDRGRVQPQYSPSGSRIAYVKVERGSNISSYDPRTRRSVPVTTGSGGIASTWPVWSPDEKWIAFVSNRAGGFNWNTFRARADGSDVVEQLTFEPSLRTVPSSWSVDDVLAVEQGPNSQRDILTLSLADGADRTLEPFIVTEFNERGGRFSPDGRWLAFTSDRSGRDEVWVTPFPAGGAPILVSLGGGKEAAWQGDGRRLFYRRGDEMWAVPVDSTGATFDVGEPELLFRGDYSYGYIDWAFNYGVHPDGKTFLMVKDGPPPKFRVVVNWFSELERLAPVED
jgi:Tol biopolymer transport system component/tRNA A-37 threonylcarbamoyl transferase component Bud32